jgi:hypothetical protein
MLTFLAGWLSGSQKQALHESFAAFVGHPAYDTDALCADLHRFAFLPGESDSEERSPAHVRPPVARGRVRRLHLTDRYIRVNIRIYGYTDVRRSRCR